MTEIEETTNNDVAEIRASEATVGVVEGATQDLDAFFSLITAGPLLLGIDFKVRGAREGADFMGALRRSQEARGEASTITDEKVRRAEAQQLAFDFSW